MKFKVGETIYHVHALPRTDDSWIDEAVVTQIDTIMKGIDAPSIYVKYNSYVSEISLRDANIIPNNYNCHRIFKTLAEANDYMTNPSQWRPLGISEEDWENEGKADYLDRDNFYHMMEY